MKNDFDRIYDQYCSLFPILGEKYKKGFQQCSLSIMDNIEDSKIHFDINGVSNYHQYFNRVTNKFIISGKQGYDKWEETVKTIKSHKGSSKYDCLIGLSGGIDSTYTCLLAKKAGLNPLILHLDNTWNSEASIKNIENTLNNLGFDYLTHVIDNRVFEQLQWAYIKSSVVDLDIITDHAIMVLLYKKAIELDLKYVITGSNVKTESIIPGDWLYDCKDQKNILSIIKNTYPSGIDLSSYPTASYKESKNLQKKANLTFYNPIDWLDYDVKLVEDELKRELSWTPFEGKHYESIWTRFYQCYILPTKYRIDKRKAHLSNLIFSNQLTKVKAQEIISTPPYSKNLLRNDLELLLTRFGLSYKEFETVMNEPVKKHIEYEYQKTPRNQFPWLFSAGRKIKYTILG